MDWDENRIFQANVGHEQEDNQFSELTAVRAKNRFREFIRNFREANVFPYRDALNRNYIKRDNNLEVDLGHVQAYDPLLQDLLQKRPTEQLGLFESAAKEALRQIVPERDIPDDELPDIHITLKSDQHSIALRHLAASDINSLIKVRYLVLSPFSKSKYRSINRYPVLSSVRHACAQRRQWPQSSAGAVGFTNSCLVEVPLEEYTSPESVKENQIQACLNVLLTLSC